MHTLKPKAYLRYGDDFIMFGKDYRTISEFQKRSEEFLREELHLSLHLKNNVIMKVRHNIHFLGTDIFSTGRRLRRRMRHKIARELSAKNYSSYLALVRAHEKRSKVKKLLWRGMEFLE